MRGAIVFNGTNALDFQDIRTNVVRIPEVIQAIREAQGIWDALNPTAFDLTNFIGSDDEIFFGQIKLKNFAAAVVQVGLLRRYLKNHELPEFLIGTVNGDSPLRVALRQISFVEMVAESEAMPKRLSLVSDQGTFLSGVRLAEYAVYGKGENGSYQKIDFETRDVHKMIDSLVTEQDVSRLIVVGPGSWGESLTTKVETLESIDLDPQLSWFWAHAKESCLAVAN